jgi:uncharacterized membrane protein YhhN
MLTIIYGLIAGGLALAYGALLVKRPPSLTRTMIKALSVAALAVAVLIEGAAPLLPFALFAFALGDGFLAQDKQKWLKAGMAAFALGHLILIFEFLIAGTSLFAGQDIVRILLQALMAGGAIGTLFWLWPALGALRWPVAAYLAVIGLMAMLAIGLPAALWLAALGAALFAVSDAILAAELFKWPPEHPARRWSPYAVWALYWLGVALIAVAFQLRLG